MREVWDRAKKPLAAVAAVVALGGGYELTQDTSSQKDAVSSARIQKLGASTVLLLDKPRGSQQGWHPECSGTRVSIGNKSNYVLTAAHCLSFTVKTRNKQAVNVLPYDSREYIVANNVSVSNKHSSAQLLGTVEAAAYLPGIGENGPDLALLEIGDAHGKSTARLKNVPAIPFSQIGAQPKIGQPVVVESYPSITNDSLTATSGEYLGRIAAPAFLSRQQQVDVVGMRVADARQDACEHGGSGASAISSTTISGPATYRSETGMESHEPIQHESAQQIAIGVAAGRESRIQLQAALHMSLSRFDVACLYTVPPVDSAQNLVSVFH